MKRIYFRKYGRWVAGIVAGIIATVIGGLILNKLISDKAPNLTTDPSVIEVTAPVNGREIKQHFQKGLQDTFDVNKEWQWLKEQGITY